jgi:Putative prokaryotic signal transducing protein
MKELLRTNDLVLLSFLEGALRSQGLECVVLDDGMAALDGGVIAIPRRLMVETDRFSEAEDVLKALRADYGPL